jgi:hypothetical protein
MRDCVFHNKTVVSVFALFLVIIAPVSADDGENASSIAKIELVAENSNPWALPQRRPQDEEWNEPEVLMYQQQFEQNSQGFVTQQELEQLEQQQMQMQLMPGDRRDLRRPIPGSSNSYMPQIYGYPSYDPSYGMGYTNPLYHTPAVSPWGSEPGLLYDGQSLPMVPNEAIGGMPPMHVPPYLDDGGAYEPEEIENNEENSVFNPFEFGRKGRLQ